MSRHFPDWLTAYSEFAQDAICPEKFHFWSGVSAVAGALERKVWIEQGRRMTYPNLYVFLVGDPAAGKTMAASKAVQDLLSEVEFEGQSPSILADQNTEAGLLLALDFSKKFICGENLLTHSSHFLYASEGSASMKELVGGGSIFPLMTALYDCPKKWAKQTAKDGYEPRYNLCLNVLACCTFIHLKDMFPDENIAGGLASRVLYIVHDEGKPRRPKFIPARASDSLRDKLLSDLKEIHSLTGPFSVHPDYVACFEETYPRNDEYCLGIKDQRVKAFLARRIVNTLKLSQVVCASESSDMLLRPQHWERAWNLVTGLEEKLPRLLEDVNPGGQESLTKMILKEVRERGGIASYGQLLERLSAFDIGRLDQTLSAFCKAKTLKLDLINGVTPAYRLLVDSEENIGAPDLQDVKEELSGGE